MTMSIHLSLFPIFDNIEHIRKMSTAETNLKTSDHNRFTHQNMTVEHIRNMSTSAIDKEKATKTASIFITVNHIHFIQCCHCILGLGVACAEKMPSVTDLL